jgi:hypothetical protein
MKKSKRETDERRRQERKLLWDIYQAARKMLLKEQDDTALRLAVVAYDKFLVP